MPVAAQALAGGGAGKRIEVTTSREVEMQLLVAMMLLSVGLFVVVQNDVIFVRAYRKEAESLSSWTPLFGGGCVCLALWLLPIKVPVWVYPVVLLLDWGSVPGLAHAVIYYCRRSPGGSREKAGNARDL